MLDKWNLMSVSLDAFWSCRCSRKGQKPGWLYAPVALSNATTGPLPEMGKFLSVMVSFCSRSILLHTLICTHACMHKYMHVHIHACARTHTHTRTHACMKHKHTHTQSQAQTWCAYTRGGRGERKTDNRDTDRDKKRQTNRQTERIRR